MDEPIERIDIEISSREQGAIKNIQSLTRTLTKLKKISDSIGELKGISQLESFTGAVNALATFVNGETFNKGLRQLRKLSKLDFTNLLVPGVAGPGIARLMDAASAARIPNQRRQDKVEEVTQQTPIVPENVVSPVATERASRFRSVLERIKTAASEAGKRLKEMHKDAEKGSDKSTSKLRELWESLKRIAMYRLLRTIIKEITQGIKEGIDNMYQWSKAFNGTFAQAMDSLATSALYMKNSFATLLEPLIESIAPIIENIVNKIADAIDMVNQFFAILRGQSSWTRAIRTQVEYAEAVEDTTSAAKELKKTILGFDELNLLNDPNSGSSKKGKKIPDYASMFEEVPIENANEGIRKVAEKVLEIVEKIRDVMAEYDITWKDILKTAGLIGAAILLWKFADKFDKGLSALLGLNKLGHVALGLAITITGVALSYSGAYGLGKGELNPLNILKTIIGNGLIVGGTYLTLGSMIGGGPALLLGAGLAIVVDLVGFRMGQYDKIREKAFQTEVGQKIQQLSKDLELKLEVTADIEMRIGEIKGKIREIENSFAGVKELIKRAFEIDENENLTLQQTRELKAIADKLSEYGIQLEFDENGHIKQTKEDVEKIYEDTMKLYKLNAYIGLLDDLYQTQALTKIELDDAIEKRDATKGIIDDLEKDFFDSTKMSGIQEGLFTYYEHLFGIQKAYELVAKGLGFWNEEQREQATLLAEAYKDYEGFQGTVERLESAYNDTAETIGKVESAIDELNQNGNVTVTTDDTQVDALNTKLADIIPNNINTLNHSWEVNVKTNDGNIDTTQEKIGAKLPGAITAFNQHGPVLLPKSDRSQLEDTNTKLTKTLPSAIDNLNNHKAATIKTDDSQLDSTLRKMQTLQERIVELDNDKLVVKKNASKMTYSAMASGGFPDQGSLFLAGEAGPELVGTVHGRTAVANSDQIVEGIAGGVREANDDVVSAIFAAAQQVVATVRAKDTATYLDGKKVSKSVTDNQNRTNRMYGVAQSNA